MLHERYTMIISEIVNIKNGHFIIEFRFNNITLTSPSVCSLLKMPPCVFKYYSPEGLESYKSSLLYAKHL